MAVNVVLAIGNMEFAMKLTDYLREEEPDWHVAVFTGTASFAKEMNGSRAVDLLIGQSGMLQAAGSLCAKARRVVELVENGVVADKGHASVPQYQPLPMLLAAFRSALRGSGCGVAVRDCTVAGVFSAGGGAGKTTVALNLIRQAGERGKRTFYLNLEPLNATAALFGSGEPDSLSRLLYGMQAHPETWLEEFDRVCRHQPRLRTDYLDAPDNPVERLALTSDLLEMLLEGLRGTGRYDLIVVDADSGPGEWHRRLAELCDRILWLTVEDPLAQAKAEMLLRYWQSLSEGITDKMLFVLNRGSGSALFNRWRLPGAGGSPYAELPYVPQWKALDQPWRLLGAPAFAGAVDSLLEQLGLAGQGDEAEAAAGAVIGGSGAAESRIGSEGRGKEGDLHGSHGSAVRGAR